MVSFTVPSRFSGPPGFGNGGYTCGLLASQFKEVMECTIRTPIPINAPLEFRRTKFGGVLRHDEAVVVAADPGAINITPPPPISLRAATEAMASSPAADPRHPFPTCFVCGPQRKVNDGLRIFPARVDGEFHAAAWTPAHEFGDRDQLLRPEFLWSAMDCPTGFASGFPLVGKLVTGQMAVQQLAGIRTGADCVIMSWPLEDDGKKFLSAACLYQDEKLCAIGKATWIKIGEP